MPTQAKPTIAEALRAKNYVKPGSEQHLQLLQTGYSMTLDEAKAVVADWEKDHKSYPLEEVRKARALIAAATAVPVPIDTEPGWKRTRAEE